MSNKYELPKLSIQNSERVMNVLGICLGLGEVYKGIGVNSINITTGGVTHEWPVTQGTYDALKSRIHLGKTKLEKVEDEALEKRLVNYTTSILIKSKFEHDPMLDAIFGNTIYCSWDDQEGYFIMPVEAIELDEDIDASIAIGPSDGPGIIEDEIGTLVRDADNNLWVRRSYSSEATLYREYSTGDLFIL